MSSSVLITRTEEPTGALRSDGALVEEGTPISMPLHLASQTSVPEPIVVDAVIGMDGRVRDVRLISSPASQLARAVVEAVSQWRYRPFYENGAPAEFTTRITFDFSGNSRKP
ncbi:MAG TPA: energy transducer TonB [Patescibacteria group bacterium]|nr:energy transducer TonB [Patescibacteria group bacterium]